MKVNKELIVAQLGNKKGELIQDDTIEELNKLIEDPEYGEEFLDQYISYFDIVNKNSSWNTAKYMNAMKFFTLIEGGNTAVDAYVKTFPDRLQSRLNRGESKYDMGGEASRYNASALVNEIRKVATIPVQLIHRHLLHKAIRKQADLMLNARSEMVQQKAAETLIRELKPAEDSNINLKIGADEDTKAQQARLVDHIGQLAMNQRKLLAAGMSIEEIQKLNIKTERDFVEADYE